MDIEKELIKIIRDVKKDNMIEIYKNTNLLSDLGMDYIMIITLVIKIEEKFKISFPDKFFRIDVLSSFSAILDMLKNLCK